LLSRDFLERKALIEVDSAAPEVIGKTSQSVKEFVRLYFRPRTPTQYNNEGIRPVTKRKLSGAHMPVPVFFLFDSKQVMGMDGVQFTDGNAGAFSHRYGDDIDFLRSIPFGKVYHTGPYDKAVHADIKYHRNAEVLVPVELGLDDLKMIVARSPAEKDMLLDLMPPECLGPYHNFIHVDADGLFYKEWTFVDEAILDEIQIELRFSSSSKEPGPFKTKLKLRDLDTQKIYTSEKDAYTANKTWRLEVPKSVTSYHVDVWLDGALAFAGTFVLAPEDMPF